MEENPYSLLLKNIRNDIRKRIPPAFRLGTVIETNPLRIDVAGTVQTNESLLKSEGLDIFTRGERLLLIPIEEEQRYIILCKVVNA